VPESFLMVFRDRRHELYQGYKGQRPPMPPDIKQALPRIHQVLRAMGIAEVSAAGVEADDVIGTLSTRALREGYFVAIVSPDKVRSRGMVSGCSNTKLLVCMNAMFHCVLPQVPCLRPLQVCWSL
jgi:hypothetical protein